MTHRQRIYLNAIRALTETLGRSPTLGELARHVDRSRNAAAAACARLVAAGHLVATPNGYTLPTRSKS